VQANAIIHTAAGAFIDTFDCSPNAMYAESCAKVDQSRGMAHDIFAVYELAFFLPLSCCSLLMFTRFMGWCACARDPWWVTKLAFTVTTALIALVDIGSSSGFGWLWYGRLVLSPFFIIQAIPSLRAPLAHWFRTVPSVFPALFLSFFAILWFVVFGMQLMINPDVVGGKEFLLPGNGFSTVGNGMYAMLWWTTGNNPPEVGAQKDNPGYRRSELWGLYFTAATFVLQLGIVSLLTAVVYESYRDLAGASVKRRLAEQCRRVGQAWIRLSTSGSPSVSLDVVNQVWYLMEPRRQQTEVARDVWEMLQLVRSTGEESVARADGRDGDHSGVMQWEIFMMLRCNEDPRAHFKLWCPRLATAMSSVHFMRVFRLIAVVHSVMAFLFISYYLRSSGVIESRLDVFHIWGYLAVIVYTLEALVRVVAFGPMRLWFQPDWGRFRCAIVLLSWVTCLTAARDHVHSARVMNMIVAYTLFLFDAFEESRHLQVIQHSVYRVFPSVAVLTTVFLCITFSWAALGVAMVGGEITTSNSALTSGNVYYTMNFNSVRQGMYTLCMVTAGNNMDQFQETYTSIIGALGAWYFQSFYLFCQWVMLNILQAFFLDCVSLRMTEERARLAALGHCDHDLSGHISGLLGQPPKALMTEVMRFSLSSETLLEERVLGIDAKEEFERIATLDGDPKLGQEGRVQDPAWIGL